MTAIERATKHGAKFEVVDGEWYATYHPRGRAVALVRLVRPTKEQAAEAYCEYFHLKKDKA